jgi:hypothetical protein
LGKPLARAEIGVVIWELIKGFEFERGWDVGKEGEERRLGKGLTGGMEGGMPVRVKKRQ